MSLDWYEHLGANNCVKVITEQEYRGIICKYVSDKGWKIVLGMEEYLFPNFQEAKFVIDRIHDDCINKYGGVKLKTIVPR